jgi:hypothetical protein
MTIKDIRIKIEDNPAFSEFNPADFGLPTEAELQKVYSDSIDNFSIPEQDPTNWLTFDPGNGEASTPSWVSINTDASNFNANGTYNSRGRYDYNSLIFKYGQESLNLYQTHGTNFEFQSSGGPRNLGYTNISDDTWVRMNHQLGWQNKTTGQIYRSHNEVWKEGSIELTLKPTKHNCTLLSGTIMSNLKTQDITFQPNADGNQFGIGIVKTGVNDPAGAQLSPNYDIKQEIKVTNAVSQDNAYSDKYNVLYDPLLTQSQAIIYEDIKSGLVLTTLDHTVRTFKVDLVNGLIRVSYEVYYGDNKKYIEFYGKTNIVNGQWHHIVINRPSPFTIKDGDNKYGEDGCIEIWVDGKLDVRSYEITTNDPLPTPNVLFNDYTNPGILNYPQFSGLEFENYVEKQPWMVEEIARTNYVGGIRDFIFRQSIALSPHSINLNYIYAITNDERSRICKATKFKATGVIVNPQVSVNKKTILKLYWDSLLDDKTKCLDGLEFDETYNVYSYSVTKKNVISPTQTFNLDLNDSTKTRTFLENVKTAVGKHIFVPKPGIIIDAQDAQTGTESGSHKNFLDYTHENNVMRQYYGEHNARFITNLQYGGVYLNPGDRILLFNQPRFSDNGVWIFNGPDNRMTRPTDVALSNYKNALVYVADGNYAGKTYIQTNNVTNIRKSAQKWIEVDNNISLSTSDVYPVHTTPWATSVGEQRFIDVNTDINFNYDIIAFMNYPTENKEIIDSIKNESDAKTKQRYKEFINNIKTAINAGKDIYVSSPMLAVDLGVVSDYVSIDQMLDTTGDAQSAAISPFENGEPASNYFDTHRNIKYNVATTLAGLTNKPTYIMTDIVTYSPNGVDSDYHIKYNYRPSGLQQGDEFFIPGLTTVPETINSKLPGYIHNQRGTAPIYAFAPNKIIFGTAITTFSNTVYNGSSAVVNPYDDYVLTIAATYGTGKIFVNCAENGYAFSRSDYNTARIQNVTAGQNSETTLTAAWQYSTKRLNKKNLYDFSDISNSIGQTTPTDGGGGAFVQAQSHCSNGIIRKKTNKGDLKYQSDLYADFTEEIFATTEIPVRSMTWLGLQWLAG